MAISIACTKENYNREEPDYIEPRAVDLGLSVKWADMNLGAKSPSGYGAYFAWGEWFTKLDFSNKSYWVVDGYSMPYEYYTDPTVVDTYLTVDEKSTLEGRNDAAAELLGNGWRMPTATETLELLNKCDWKETVRNGHKGYNVSRNGKSIFIPVSMCIEDMSRAVDVYRGEFGDIFWTSSAIEPGRPAPGNTYAVCLEKDDATGDLHFLYRTRISGLTIRPVKE